MLCLGQFILTSSGSFEHFLSKVNTEDTNANLQKDALDFLIQFTTKMEEAQLWPQGEEEGATSAPSSLSKGTAQDASSGVVAGCRAKAKCGPPLQLHQGLLPQLLEPQIYKVPPPEQVAPPQLKASPPMSSVPSMSTRFSPNLAPGLPMSLQPDLSGKDKPKLVCTPLEMQKFLYGQAKAVSDQACRFTYIEESVLQYTLHGLTTFFCDNDRLIDFINVWTCQEVEWEAPCQGGGWFRKVGGLIVAWKLGEVHRMRRLLQRWDDIPQMKTWTNSLASHVKKFGWPKNLDGEFGMLTK